ncbi:MAG TPA: tetratricopeptide repeat protein [Trichormus sp.]|jgi:tetratricopeptide (TPR) repeat protein
MRINLPSALLLSGTVMLFSAASGFAATADDADNIAPQQSTQLPEAAPTADAAKTEAIKKDPALAPTSHSSANARGMFKFGDNSKDAVTDPADAVEKSRALHDKAMELFKANSVKEAVAKEQEAIDAAPHYWLPHAGMTFLIMTDKHKAFDAIHEASLSLQGKHDSVAERNCAKLFQMVHWMPPAVQALQAAIKMEPDNWVPKVGLADLAINQNNFNDARKELAKIDLNSANTYEAFSEIGLRYLEAEDYAKAKELLSKAIEKAPDQKAKQECADRLYVVGVKLSDADLLQKTSSQISDEFKKSRPDMILEGRIILSNNPKEDIASIIADAANIQVGAPGNIFYSIGRSMIEKGEAEQNFRNKFLWRKGAIDAFKQAVIRNETETKYQIALAAAQDSIVNYAGVQEILTSMKEALPPDAGKLTLGTAEPSEQKLQMANFMKYNLVKSLTLTHATPAELASTTPPPAYTSAMHEWGLKITKASCSCHARGLASGLSREPGVIITNVTKEDLPTVTIVFNSKVTNVKKLMATSYMTNLKDPYEVVTDKPIEKIADVTALMYASDNSRPALTVKRSFALEMPTDNSGRVAQTSDQPVH